VALALEEQAVTTAAGAVVNRPVSNTPIKNRCLIIHAARPSERFKTIVVLGVERGGTSMVAGVLRALGIDLGKRVGLNHEDARFITTDPQRLKRIIAIRNQEAAVWGFKMPNAATILDFFEANLRKPHYLIVYRNLASVADSWQQRGTGEYLGAIERGLEFYRLIAQHLRQSKRPAMIINYERATADKRGVVEDFVAFLGLDVGKATIERAVGVVADDGEGYFNLPEQFFLVEPRPLTPDRPPLPTNSNWAEIVGPGGWITFESINKKLVLTLPDRKLPQKFWLMLDFESEPRVDMATLPLRIYFDFIGLMIPAHCARPPVVHGRNHYLVETSGLASAIGFGPLLLNSKFKLSPVLLEALPSDA
jgi:hypothetical protein